jgi:hypothetical protein
MQMRPSIAHGESSPWFRPARADLGDAPDWIFLTPDELSVARKRPVDARTAHDHRQGVGCDDLRAAYDELARARAPMGLPDPLPFGTERWNRP